MDVAAPGSLPEPEIPACSSEQSGHHSRTSTRMTKKLSIRNRGDALRWYGYGHPKITRGREICTRARRRRAHFGQIFFHTIMKSDKICRNTEATTNQVFFKGQSSLLKSLSYITFLPNKLNMAWMGVKSNQLIRGCRLSWFKYFHCLQRSSLVD